MNRVFDFRGTAVRLPTDQEHVPAPRTTERVPLWLYKPSEDEDDGDSEINRSALYLKENLSLLSESENTFPITLLEFEVDTVTQRRKCLQFDADNTSFSIDEETRIPIQNVRYVVPNPTRDSSCSSHIITVAYNAEGGSGNLSTPNLLHFYPELKTGHEVVIILSLFNKLLFNHIKPFCSRIWDVATAASKMKPLYIGTICPVISSCSVEAKDVDISQAKSCCCIVELNTLSIYLHPFSCRPLNVFHFIDQPQSSVVTSVYYYLESQMLIIRSPDYQLSLSNVNVKSEFFPFARAITKIKVASSDVFVNRDQLVNYLIPKMSHNPIVSYKVATDYYSLEKPRSVMLPVDHGNTINTTSVGLRSRLQDKLNNAVAMFKDTDEVALPWIIAEDEIKAMRDAGFQRDTDFGSGGLDPNNLEHFNKCITDIGNHLTCQRYDIAYARMQDTRSVFQDTENIEIMSVLTDDDIVLLKKIYYDTFVSGDLEQDVASLAEVPVLPTSGPEQDVVTQAEVPVLPTSGPEQDVVTQAEVPVLPTSGPEQDVVTQAEVPVLPTSGPEQDVVTQAEVPVLLTSGPEQDVATSDHIPAEHQDAANADDLSEMLFSKEWEEAKRRLKTLIDVGYYEETDFLSQDIEINSIDNFQLMLEKIKKSMKEKRYEEAVSRMKDARVLFYETRITEIQEMLQEENLKIMEKIYSSKYDMLDLAKKKYSMVLLPVRADDISDTQNENSQSSQSMLDCSVSDGIQKMLELLKRTLDKFHNPLMMDQDLMLRWSVIDTEIQPHITSVTEGANNSSAEPVINSYDDLVKCFRRIGRLLDDDRYVEVLEILRRKREECRVSTTPILKTVFSENDLSLLKKIHFKIFE